MFLPQYLVRIKQSYFIFFGRVMMKTSVLLATLLAALFLTACGEKAAEMPATDAPAAEVAPTTDAAAPAADAASAAPASEAAPAAVAETATGGGYEPTAEERIPGETRPVEAAPASEAAPAAPAAETAPASNN